MSFRIQTSFLLDPEACTHCLDCVKACEPGAIEVTEDDIYIDGEECDGCEECALACPTTAIQVSPAEFSTTGGVATIAEPQAVERPRPASAVPWTLSDVLIALAVLLALTFVQRALRLPMLIAGFSPDSTHVILTLWAVFFYAAMILTLVVLAKRRGAKLEDFGVRPFDIPRGIAYSVGALIVLTVLTSAYRMISSGAGFETPVRTEVQILRWFGFGPLGFALAILVAVILAPIAEELFFRGFVHGALRERMGVTTSIALSSLIFALYHGNAWLIIPVMFLGMALALLFEMQQSLGPPLLFHALNNLLGIMLIYMFPKS